MIIRYSIGSLVQASHFLLRSPNNYFSNHFENIIRLPISSRRSLWAMKAASGFWWGHVACAFSTVGFDRCKISTVHATTHPLPVQTDRQRRQLDTHSLHLPDYDGVSRGDEERFHTSHFKPYAESLRALWWKRRDHYTVAVVCNWWWSSPRFCGISNLLHLLGVLMV